ncbi:hypothetical protein HPB50_010138 [Hyalomma asiaticum]|uniref:Uncharacterized protein n=1 Tax=Hyalomma asiaticum TaxID=266040 RepID=A0ACB7TD35_HYAAI|nr:hypothetical protein HPB50_010138 [Hyalomma asiaticum]
MPTQNLGQQLAHAKDTLDCAYFLGVVCKIPCGGCDTSYIGEIGNFKWHLKQHHNNVAKGYTTANTWADQHNQAGHTDACIRPVVSDYDYRASLQSAVAGPCSGTRTLSATLFGTSLKPANG